MKIRHCPAEDGNIQVNVHAGEDARGWPTGHVVTQYVGPLGEMLIVKFSRAEALAFAKALTEKAHTIKTCKNCGEGLFPNPLEVEGEWIDTAWGEAVCYPHDDMAKKHEVEEEVKT